MWESFLNHITQIVTQIGLKLLCAILVLVVGIWLARRLIALIFKQRGIQRVDRGVQTFLQSALKIFFYAVIIIVAAGILGIPMSSFITILASAGVAIGLALQGSLSNFAGGIMLLLFKPFKVGDYIETDRYAGIVRDINVFYTMLVTYDNKHVTLPNGTLSNSAIINHFTEPKRRLDFVFSVSYDSDAEQAQRVIQAAAAQIPFVLSDPAPLVFMSGHGQSSLDFTVRVWCDSEHYWDVDAAAKGIVKRALDENGLVIPYPQMDVHIKS